MDWLYLFGGKWKSGAYCTCGKERLQHEFEQSPRFFDSLKLASFALHLHRRHIDHPQFMSIAKSRATFSHHVSLNSGTQIFRSDLVSFTLRTEEVLWEPIPRHCPPGGTTTSDASSVGLRLTQLKHEIYIA